MKPLLDENVPLPMARIVRLLLKHYFVEHVAELSGWAGTKDVDLYARAAADGFQIVVTNDTKQLSRPREVVAIAKSGLHPSSTARITSTAGWWVLAQPSPPCAPGCPMPWLNSTGQTASA